MVEVSAEWLTKGGEMPPMKAENLFNQKAVEKVREKYTKRDVRRIKNRDKFIDMNDPRNEAVLRYLRETQNLFVKQLLKEDARNPLHNLDSFRHQLLLARKTDPAMSGVPIPLLEMEIIDESKGQFYIEKLKEIDNRKRRIESITNAHSD